MCDEVKQSPTMTNKPIEGSGADVGQTYRYNNREDLKSAIAAYRYRADALEALLKSIPESITDEANSGIGFINSLVWQKL